MHCVRRKIRSSALLLYRFTLLYRGPQVRVRTKKRACVDILATWRHVSDMLFGAPLFGVIACPLPTLNTANARKGGGAGGTTPRSPSCPLVQSVIYAAYAHRHSQVYFGTD